MGMPIAASNAYTPMISQAVTPQPPAAPPPPPPSASVQPAAPDLKLATEGSVGRHVNTIA